MSTVQTKVSVPDARSWVYESACKDECELTISAAEPSLTAINQPGLINNEKQGFTRYIAVYLERCILSVEAQ